MNRLLIFLLSFVFVFNACKESENIVCPRDSSEKPNYHNPSFGDYTYYTFGECNELGDFINPPEEIYFAYGWVLTVNGLVCTQVELRKKGSEERKSFFLSVTDKWVKILSPGFYPILPETWVDKKYCPSFWQNLWTSDYSSSKFDATVDGTYWLPSFRDSFITILPVPCVYKFQYKYERLEDKYFNVRGVSTPVRASGTKIIFESIATLKNDRFERVPDSVAKNFDLKFNYDEFYFNDDRSSYLDKVEMHVYRNETVGIVFIWIKHKTIHQTKYYKYIFKANIKIID